MSTQDFNNSTFTQIGNLLSGSWELTQRIFESLSFRDVVRARSVCRTWADVGNKILEQRRRLHYITTHSIDCPTTQGKLAHGEASPRPMLEDFFEQLVSKPCYCLAFCSCDWFTHNDWEEYVMIGKNFGGNKDHKSLSHYLNTSLPTSCEFGIVCSTGVVGSVENRFAQWWPQSSEVNQELLSLLCDDEEEEGGRKLREKLGEKKTGQSEGGGMKTGKSVAGRMGRLRPRDGTSRSEDLSDDLEAVPNPAAPQSSVGYSVEIERVPRCPEAISLLLIPHHPGFNLKFFNVCDKKLLKEFSEEKCGSISCSDFERVVGLTQDDPLKALLVFDGGLDDNYTEAFVQAALTREHHKLAVGGGVADHLVTRQSNNAFLRGFGVAVVGRNVCAASVVIPSSVYNPKTVVNYITELKNCGLPEEQSVAFMFTCCGRGYSWYRQRGKPSKDYHNVETKAFRRAFPNTPIFGFFGAGEIGMTHLPKFCEKGEEEPEVEEVPYKRRKRKVFHQFSTIIVLLSFL